MRTRAFRSMVALVLVGVSLAATLGVASAAGITLRTPHPHAAIRQNNATTGCAYDPDSGYGYMISFDWDASAVAGVDHYQVWDQLAGFSARELVETADTGAVFVECNAFVIDANLTGWNWWVVAVDADGNSLDQSEMRPFRFLPCRLHGGGTCSAPAQ